MSFRQKIVLYYCLIWFVLFWFKWSNDMLLYQQQPAFLYNTFDVTNWLFAQSGLPLWLLQTKHFLLFDIVYYTAPAFLLVAAFLKQKRLPLAAAYVLLINWGYLSCYFVYPISSYTIFVVWLLFPVAFLAKNEKDFRFLFDGLRYFFLYFFFSAGVWKLVNGGVFNSNQLSAILLDQHKEMLTNSPRFWLSCWYEWMIVHTTVSYSLYIIATAMELSFAIGFFTRRFDRYLIAVYTCFLVFDYLIMRIPYFETLPFLLTLACKPVKDLERGL